MSSINISSFFNNRFFEIPKYQRGYAWEVQNIRDLFDDIIESIESKSNHYIGTIVLSKSDNDNEKYYIVDGQQRIITITMIISSLIKNLSKQDASFYERLYIKDKNKYKIIPLNRDQKYFIDLLNGKNVNPKNKSQRFLKSALEEINYKVKLIKDKLEFLESILKLEVMLFIEETEGDAIRIFLTVNDRGKPLSNMEKAKSLLNYFSNRYLNKSLDNTINNHFSDIFEIYDDIKQVGEELNINLIKNKDFNEDNLMRYHFVTFCNENYDPTANYVLQFLKNKLTQLRNDSKKGDYSNIEEFINSYIISLKNFFYYCRKVIELTKKKSKYFKLFVILNLSATLYPLIIKLCELNLLEKRLQELGRKNIKYFDLIELIEVRVYKTRGTDPKADISRLVYKIENKSQSVIENILLWFNNRWMPKEEFQLNLSRGIYGNRALIHIFIKYNEHLLKKEFNINELKEIVKKSPNIEHILSQTPNFDPIAFGFSNKEDFIDYEHNLGNLTILEKGLNSSIQNKIASDKIEGYSKSIFTMTKLLGSRIDTSKGFNKMDLIERTVLLAKYCVETWWCDRPKESSETTINLDVEIK